MFDTPTFELHANHGPLMMRVSSAMIVLSFVGVCLRFLSRRLVHQPFLWDDWIIVVALPLSWAMCIMEILSAKHGSLGRHIELATEDTIEIFFKDLYAVQLVYSFSIALTKFSIMAFYRRIFRVPQTKLPLIVLGGVVAAWLMATALVAILSCLPTYDFWDRTVPTNRCINTSVYFIAAGATNIFTDIVILAFPIPLIWKLQIFRAEKLSVIGIFLLGGLVVLVSCLRLVAIVQANGNPDITWAFLPLAIWTTIETNVAIFCACIPCMRPLLRVLLGKPIYNGANEIGLDFGTMAHKTWWPSVRTDRSRDNDANFLWLTDTPEETPVGTKTVISAAKMELQDLNLPVARDAIHVERKIVWT